MTVETAETLKQELTDKYVVVAEGVPELKRFRGLTGTVKTVNMSGRALVQFDGPADISWYDIDPTYLNIIDTPLPKQKAVEEAPAAKPTAEKPAPKKAAGMSPLEMARQQGAAGGGAVAKPKPAAGGEKKLSPLELARQQGAAGSAPAAKPKPAKAATQADAGKKLSPLELARQQGAAKAAGSAPAESEAAPDAEPETATAAEPAPEKPAKPKPPATADTAGLSKLELARLQGPAKS